MTAGEMLVALQSVPAETPLIAMVEDDDGNVFTAPVLYITAEKGNAVVYASNDEDEHWQEGAGS